jgi:hypothetical protein
MSADHTMNYCGHPGPGSTHQSAGGSPRRVLHRQNPCRIRGSRCPACGLASGLPARSRRLAERLETGIPVRTLLWLGELHQYAEADGGPALLGRPADLLDDEGHMVITTVWPQQWTAYTAAARAGLGKADLAGTAGRLLNGLPELADCDPAGIDPVRGGGHRRSLPVHPRQPGSCDPH